MSNILTIRRGEDGIIQPITIVNPALPADVLANYVENDTTIIFKETSTGSVILTLDKDDFAFNTPSIDWTVTDTHINTLPKSSYVGFIHLRNNAAIPPLEEIASFTLKILES